VIIPVRRIRLVITFALIVFRLTVIALTLAFVGRWRCRRRLASFFRENSGHN
jgi:hypothetical protein